MMGAFGLENFWESTPKLLFKFNARMLAVRPAVPENSSTQSHWKTFCHKSLLRLTGYTGVTRCWVIVTLLPCHGRARRAASGKMACNKDATHGHTSALALRSHNQQGCN